MPFIPHADPRVIDSTGALEFAGIPKRLLALGGRIIGPEMATVYHALGAKVTVVELMDQNFRSPRAMGSMPSNGTRN